MKTLIIYDLEGTVISSISGSYKVPVGIPYLEIEVPIGKMITGIDTETNLPILVDTPKSEMELLREVMQEQELAILELASMIGGTI